MAAACYRHILKKIQTIPGTPEFQRKLRNNIKTIIAICPKDELCNFEGALQEFVDRSPKTMEDAFEYMRRNEVERIKLEQSS